ncbi:PAS domain S-box protein [Halosimplex salinum]|uniref:PAS domain S-box protein n=1 Tax=Halosimplex salinum TaxID=1710538 RepID=UPI000F49C8F5|nr:PAS domain S-box protein [Halosimplex salinum]
MSGRSGPSDTAFWGDADDGEARERFQSLVNAIDDGIFYLDAEGRVVAVDDVFADLTGAARDDLRGEPVAALFDGEDASAIERTVDRLSADSGEASAHLDLTVRDGDGRQIPCEVRMTPLESDGGLEGSVGVVRELDGRETGDSAADVSEGRERPSRDQDGERERELRQTERRFETVFEDPNILVGLLDPDGTVLDINETAMEYIDADLADVRGEAFWETPWWGDGDDVQSDVREWTERAASGEYVDFQADLTRPDGERYVLEGYFRPVTNDDGDVVSIIVSDRDVTERTERERQLVESERRYRTLAEYFPNGIVTLFDRDLQYTLVAGQGFDRIPVRPGEVEGAHFSEVWDEDTAEALEPLFEGAIDGEERSVELEYAGREWVVHAVPITDERGDVFAGMTMAQDITEQKEREQYLRDAKSQIEAAAEAGAVGTWEWHVPEDRFVADASLARTFGIEPEAAREGVSLDRLVSSIYEADRERVEREIEEAIESCGEYETEYRVRDADDELRWVIARGHVECDEAGDPVMFPGALTDITERKEQQREISRSERRYRTLVENFPNGSVGLFDEDLRYTVVGGQLLDTLDLSPADRTGKSIYEIHSEDLLEDIEPYFRSALAGERNSFEVEYRGRHLFAHTLPVRNQDDDVFAGMLVVQDVTERREAQRELRESEAKFRMLAENLEEIVWMAAEDGEEFVYLNPAFEEVWGIERQHLYDDPLSFLDAVHPDDRERVRERFTALPERDFDEEFRIRRPDGEVRWVHARGTRVFDENSEMARVVGIGEDVTERVEREAELERALDLLERTERIADVGGWEIDPETRDVFWTEYLFELLSVDADEEPPLDEALDMYHEDDRPRIEAAVADALENGDAFDEEVRLRTGSGELRWLRLQGVPERVDGDVASFRGAAQDVTERKEREQRLEDLIEQLQTSNERLEQFAYAASHDLQEPLRMVSSYLQLVEKRYADELDEDGREFIEFAVDGADRMRDMVEGLLQYSRVDTRGESFEPVDLDAVLGDVRDDLQVRIEESDAEITADALPTVAGDGGQLRQVFQNLLENAIQYSGDEPPRVRITAERDAVRTNGSGDGPTDERRESDGDRWAISVRDEGIGIDPSDTDRVFEVFQSLHADETAGTGIGLALCERIVERHGGDIWVESEPGVGSTFTFTLPTLGDGSE